MARRMMLIAALGAALLAGCEEESVIQFGAVVPLTGDFDIYGQAVSKGIELAVEEIQRQHEAGEYPYAVELTVSDSKGDVELASQLLEEHIDRGALAVVGGVMSIEALQMVSVADRYDRVLMSPSASTPLLTGISKNFYRVFPSDSREGTTMGNFASQKLKLSTAVILAAQQTYAKGIQEVFQAEFERNGGTVLELIEYPAGAADFSGFIERVLNLDPDAVYVAAFAIDIGKMIASLRDRGYEGRILTTAAFSSPEAIEQLGERAEGVFLTQAAFEAASEDPSVQAFVEKYRQKYGMTPDLYSAHGYDAMMVLAEALEEGGPSSNDFWKSVRGLRDFEGVTGTIQFDERGDVQKFPRVYVIQDGNLIDYEREVERRRRELLERLRRLEEAQRRRRQQSQ